MDNARAAHSDRRLRPRTGRDPGNSTPAPAPDRRRRSLDQGQPLALDQRPAVGSSWKRIWNWIPPPPTTPSPPLSLRPVSPPAPPSPSREPGTTGFRLQSWAQQRSRLERERGAGGDGPETRQCRMMKTVESQPPSSPSSSTSPSLRSQPDRRPGKAPAANQPRGPRSEERGQSRGRQYGCRPRHDDGGGDRSPGRRSREGLPEERGRRRTRRTAADADAPPETPEAHRESVTRGRGRQYSRRRS